MNYTFKLIQGTLVDEQLQHDANTLLSSRFPRYFPSWKVQDKMLYLFLFHNNTTQINEQTLIGCIGIWIPPSSGHLSLWGLCVHAKEERKGYGSILVQKALAYCQSIRPFQLIWLMIEDKSLLLFYGKHGFKVQTKRERHLPQEGTVLVFRLRRRSLRLSSH